MIFRETKLKGTFFIELEKLDDDRGFFARAFCQREFEIHGLKLQVAQCSISVNKKKGTVRGMHYQVLPHEEAKLVRCTRGAIYDVILDLRADSATHKKWLAVELSSDNCRMVHIPEGVAHGFQTLEDNTEVFYQMSQLFHPECARGVRWNDPAFGITWPLGPKAMSEKDRNYPYYES